MTWLTKVYLTIKNLKSPYWFKELTAWLTINVLIPTLKQFTDTQIMKLESLIVAAERGNLKGTDKLNWVAKEYYESLSDMKPRDVLNYAIETLIQRLKFQGIIKF